MYENKIIKQDSPGNILWQIFRNMVEEENIPSETDERNLEFIRQLISREK